MMFCLYFTQKVEDDQVYSLFNDEIDEEETIQPRTRGQGLKMIFFLVTSFIHIELLVLYVCHLCSCYDSAACRVALIWRLIL